MLEEGKNILKYSHGDKSLKVSFIIYADLECFIKKSNFVKIIQQILTQKERLSINLQDTH